MLVRTLTGRNSTSQWNAEVGCRAQQYTLRLDPGGYEVTTLFFEER